VVTRDAPSVGVCQTRELPSEQSEIWCYNARLPKALWCKPFLSEQFLGICMVNGYREN
jgi:hypothetical protein